MHDAQELLNASHAHIKEKAKSLNHCPYDDQWKWFTLQWRQFCELMWSFGSPFSSETYLHETGMTRSEETFLVADAARDHKKFQQGLANLHTRKPGLDNNVILVQHTLEDLSFQVL